MKKFLQILATVFILCFLSLKANAENNIKFIQIADTHLAKNSEYSLKVLESAVADINAQENISFVIFTGDNINNPKEENLKEFVKIANKLNVPYYVALGNHDVYKNGGLSKVRYFEIFKEANILFRQKSPNYVFKSKGYVFIIVDGAKEIIPGPAGYYKEDTLNWLDKQLKKYEKKDVIIFQHFPIEYPAEVSNMHSYKTYKAEEYNKITSNHNNVLAIITGHFHINDEIMKNGIYHISTPSILNLPQTYKIIDIVTVEDFSPIIYTQLKEFPIKD